MLFYFFVLVLTLLSLDLHAICKISDGTKLIKLNDGERVSLLDTGMSLGSHKIQDQDGIGTCYANTSSVLLKSTLPGNPDISYIHAALEASTNGWANPNWSRTPAQYIKDDKEEFLSGGYICETVAALKKTGGACPKEFSILENKEQLDPYVQADAFQKVGSYFDTINRIRKNPTKMANLKNELERIVDGFIQLKGQLIQECKDESFLDLPNDLALQRILGIELLASTPSDNSNLSEACSEDRLQAISKMLAPGSITRGDSVLIVNDKVVMESFRSKLLTISGIVEKIQNTDTLSNDEFEKFKHDIGLVTDKFLHDEITKNLINKDCENSNFLSADVLGSALIKGFNDQKGIDCDNLPNSNLVDASNRIKCNYSGTYSDKVFEALIPLIELNRNLDNSLINDLTNPIARNGKQLKDLLVPNCQNKDRLFSMSNLSCSSFSMCDHTVYLNDFENRTYSGPKNDCYDMGSARSIVRTHVFKNLKKQRAVGISVCTSFMKTNKGKTNFCNDPLPGIDGHGYHAMTISGYRCEKGKIEYQVLNSWGKDCPKASKEENPAIKCDQDEQGNSTGSFWVKEDTLVDSTLEITQLTTR